MCSPSGEIATVYTSSLCPANVRTSAPVSESHTRIVVSAELETMYLLSREIATE